MKMLDRLRDYFIKDTSVAPVVLCLGRTYHSAFEASELAAMPENEALATLLGSEDFRRNILRPVLSGRHPQCDHIGVRERRIISKYLRETLQLSVGIPQQGPVPWARIQLAVFKKRAYLAALRETIPLGKLEMFFAALEQLASEPVPHFAGSVQVVQSRMCRGHALDLNNPERILTLNFFAGPVFVGSVKADKIHRASQELYNTKSQHGFEFRLTIPTHLRAANTLSLRVEDAATGQIIGQERTIMTDRSNELAYVQRLLGEMTDLKSVLRKNGSIPPELQNAVTKIESALPSLQRYNAFSLANYDLYCRTYTAPGAPEIPRGAPALYIVNDSPDFSAPNGTTVYPDLSLALKKAKNADLIVFAGDDDILHPDLPAYFAAAAATHKNARLIYCDHDQISDADRRSNPNFKPDFDYHLLLQRDYIGPAFAVRASELNSNAIKPVSAATIALTLNNEKKIHHIDQVLWSVKADNYDPVVHKTIVQAHLGSRQGTQISISDTPVTPHHNAQAGTLVTRFSPESTEEKLAIIIPTRNGLDMVKPCVESLLSTMSYPEQTELLIMDNQSDDPATQQWLADVVCANIRVVAFDHDFNWSAINNAAVAETDANLLLFLNNDTLATGNGWDKELRGLLELQDTGCVGARLLYEDGTIQHAGVILFDHGVATHEAMGDTCDHGLYLGRTQMTHATSAVTGAFLACRRDVFETVGGFDADNLSVTFNDIDFCLKIRESGFTNLYTPNITFYHLESKSRGFDAHDPLKEARATSERIWMENRWKEFLSTDPYYPAQFARFGRPFAQIVPRR